MKGSRRAFATLIIVAAIATVTVFTPTANAETSAELPPEVPATVYEIQPVLDAHQAKIETFNKEITATLVSDVNSPASDSLKKDVEELIAKGPGNPLDGYYTLLQTITFKAEYLKMVAALDNAYLQYRDTVNLKVTEWKTAVQAEKDRLAEEERKRQEAEAEAARKAAEETAQNNSSNSGSSSNGNYSGNTNNNTGYSGGGGGESQEQRLARIASTLPFYVPPIIITDRCMQSVPNALGCYAWQSVIEVTSRGLSRNDCVVKHIIAHETRHYQQHMEGLADNHDGPWLENDAAAFAYGYGCRP